jgi:hypothetical protein
MASGKKLNRPALSTQFIVRSKSEFKITSVPYIDLVVFRRVKNINCEHDRLPQIKKGHDLFSHALRV